MMMLMRRRRRSLSNCRRKNSAASSSSWRSAIALLVGCIIALDLPLTTSAAWFSYSAPSSSASKEEKEKGKDNDDKNKNVNQDNNNRDDYLVSPIVNRELEASVVAQSWPTTPQNVFCEAHAYHSSTGSSSASNTNGNDFLNRLASEIIIANEQRQEEYTYTITYRDALKMVLKASPFADSSTSIALLELSLSMRAYSPTCELHRGLARRAATILKHQQQDKDGSSSRFNDNDDILSVIYPSGKVLSQEQTLQLQLDDFVADENDFDIEALLLPDEIPIGGNEKNNTSSTFVILYANMGTMAFAKAYQKLLEHSKDHDDLRFVVRHLGDVRYEEGQEKDPKSASSSTSSSSPVVLQGYGVRLDIRNVEYKVFDDRKDSSEASSDDNDDQSSNGMLNLTNAAQKDDYKILPQYLAGVNLTALMGLDDGDDDDDDTKRRRRRIQTELWKKHESQQAHAQIIPPVWQRRQLPLQAATVIASSKDPLATLEEVSQNLPSVASSLVRIKVSDTVLDEATKLEQGGGGGRRGGGRIPTGVLFINGRAVSYNRPSFNIFEVLESISSEQNKLSKLQEQLGPYMEFTQLEAVQRAWMMGEEFMMAVGGGDDDDEDEDAEDEENPGGGPEEKVYRIDVGRGGKQAIMYLNDLEKDEQYEQWGRSVTQALMSMQFGMPPAVRRNLFTFLAVMDPIEETQSVGVNLALQLLQSNFPARLAVLIVDEQSVRECSKWIADTSPEDGEPCPQSAILDGEPTLEDLKDIKGTTQALHRLVTKFAVDKQKEGGASLAYLEYLMPSLAEKQEGGGDLSMYDLVDVHSNLVLGMGLTSLEDAQSDALKALLDLGEEEDGGFTYGTALRFAADKAIKPGMSFLNGRPLPGLEEEGEAVGAAFGNEQRSVFGLIAKGEINDMKPRSVYAKLLSGDNVFKKFHPLLSGVTNEDSYVELANGFGADSLLIPESASESTGPHFVVEAYVDFSNVRGIDLATKIVGLLNSFPSSLTSSSGKIVNVRLSYRLVPRGSSTADSALCQILSHSSALGAPALQSALSKLVDSPSSTAKDILQSVPNVPEATIEKIVSSSTEESCANVISLHSKAESDFIAANGRKFVIEAGTIPTKDDIELLLNMELRRAKTVTALVEGSGSTTTADSVSRAAYFLAYEEARPEQRRNPKVLTENSDGALHFEWNDKGKSDDNDLKVHITTIVDPVSESAQRISTFLRIVRDKLRVPLTVLLAPDTLADGDSDMPITSYYRFVADHTALQDEVAPVAHFTYLPRDHVLTLRMDVPEPWNVQQSSAVQDTDNLRCDVQVGCGDEPTSSSDGRYLTQVQYGLKSLLVFGQCYEPSGSPPNGLMLTLTRSDVDTQSTELDIEAGQDVEVGMDGMISESRQLVEKETKQSLSPYSDTLVMKNVGYWQLHAAPGVWSLQIAEKSKGAEIFDIVEGSFRAGKLSVEAETGKATKSIVLKDFVNKGELLLVKRRPGNEKASLFHAEKDESDADEPINVFSLATGHLYERFLKIMMLSVTKRTSRKVKFWLFENFLSPSFKESARAMAEKIGASVEFVTYKWPEWLRGQSEKQRIIWGYKILFLDVLFPLNVKKIIYVDADQVLRGDLAELWDMDLEGKPYGYTPMCSSRESTLGYQFWREGFWKTHLQGKPYHISALYVVDLELFRKTHVGDKLRATYQQLSADPNSLANLDQDLPNYAQHQVPIFSLPQDWLWCESWCSDETKATAKTIDLCNNPRHKEPKVSMAKRIVSGELFPESWVELDAEVERYEKEYRESLQ